MDSERRQHPRLSCGGIYTARIECVPSAGHPKVELPCKLVNLSEAGACVEIDRQIGTQEPIELRLMQAGSTRTFKLRGRLKWVRPVASLKAHFLGVEFNPAEEPTRSALGELLGSLPDKT